MSTRVIESVQAVFDANGEARGSVAPTVYGTRWTVTNLATFSDSPTQCELRVYRGSESPSNYLCGTYTGNNDSNGDTFQFAQLENIVFVWRNGTPGARVTGTVSGTQEGR